MLGLGPQCHLCRPGSDEQKPGHSLGRQSKQNPSVDLESVVGAGEPSDKRDIKGEATGDCITCRFPGGAQVGQDDVRAGVAKLADHGQSKQQNSPVRRRGGVVRVVDKVGDEGREAPVVGAVLEEVGERHGAVREAVVDEFFPRSFRG